MTSSPSTPPGTEIRTAFVPAVLYPLGLLALGLGLVGGGLVLVRVISLVPVLVGAALVLGVAGLQLHQRWRRTCLRLEAERLVFETGGLGTSSSTELPYSHVTHLGHELPIVESRLLGSGRIRIESAGSGSAEIDLPHLPDPRGAFRAVVRAMEGAGIPFESEPVHAMEAPALSGILLEVGLQFLAGLFVFGFLGVILTVPESSSSPPVLDPASARIAGLGALGLVLAWCALGLVDGTRQRCALFDSNVAFYGGLPERTTWIPLGNVADCRVTRGLVGRLLGHWTVQVSCQGAGNEIRMAHLPAGDRLSERLGELLRDRQQARAQASLATQARTPEARSGGPRQRPPLDRDRKYQAQFRMAPLRNLSLLALGWLLFGFGITLALNLWGTRGLADDDWALVAVMVAVSAFHSVRWLLRVLRTHYQVGADDIREDYSFVGSRSVRFSFDKVTALQVSRNPLDHLFSTGTVKLWSIGSAEELTLSGIPWQQDLEALLLTKLGIQPQDPVLELTSELGATSLLPGRPGWVLLLVLVLGGALGGFVTSSPGTVGLALGLGALVALPTLAYQVLFYRTSRLAFLDHSVCYTRGVLVRQRTHVPYACVKGLTATRFPGMLRGDLRVDIAGERVAPQQQGQAPEGAAAQSGVPVLSNHFTVGFVDRVFEEAAFFDALQWERPSREDYEELRARALADGPPAPEREHVPSLGRRLLPVFLGLAPLGLVVAGIAWDQGGSAGAWIGGLGGAILLAFLGLIAAYLGTVRYALEPGAVAWSGGLVYRSRTTVTYDQVDFVRVSRGILDQIFGTGQVAVHTTGSRMAELTLWGLGPYQDFGQDLEARAQAARAQRPGEGC